MKRSAIQVIVRSRKKGKGAGKGILVFHEGRPQEDVRCQGHGKRVRTAQALRADVRREDGIHRRVEVSAIRILHVGPRIERRMGQGGRRRERRTALHKAGTAQSPLLGRREHGKARIGTIVQSGCHKRHSARVQSRWIACKVGRFHHHEDGFCRFEVSHGELSEDRAERHGTEIRSAYGFEIGRVAYHWNRYRPDHRQSHGSGSHESERRFQRHNLSDVRRDAAMSR